MRLSIAQRLAGGFSLVLLILVIIGWVSYRSTIHHIRSTALVRQSALLNEAQDAVLLDLEDAERGERGYLITGDESYLKPYNEALSDFPRKLQDLQELSPDTAQKQAELDELQSLTSAKLAQLKATIDMRKQESFAAARSMMLTGNNQLPMARIRALVARLKSAEAVRLWQLELKAQGANHQTILTILLGTALAFILVVISGAAIVRSFTVPISELVAGAARIGAGDLAHRVPAEDIPVEIGQLGVAFNSMAGKLRDREDRLRLLEAAVTGANDAVQITEEEPGDKRQSKIIYVNDAFCRMTGYSRQEALGHSPIRVGPKTDLQKVAQVQEQLANDQPVRAELVYYRKDGSEQWIEFSVTPIADENGVCSRRVSIQRDVSERKLLDETIQRQQQELEERNREVERATLLKSQFLASMSHELRTPLNAILGFSELLSSEAAGPLQAKQKRFVEHIHTGGAHLLKLINDVLDLSKIEAGQIEFSAENFMLGGAVSEVLGNLVPLALAKQIDFQEMMEPELRVFADRFRFKQILYNLLSNAIKFTPNGSPIRVEALGKGKFAEVAVQDYGIGIRAADQEIVFEEFRQVGNTSSGIKEGTGLGLAITRKLVEQQGGTIGVKSEPGKGSRFIFTVRLSAAEPGFEAKRILPLPLKRENPVLLVVDDEASARELLASHLSGDGYRVETAACEQEAVTKARSLLPDAITLDIMMPGGSGWDTLYALRKDPDTSSIPVIIISAVEERGRGFSEGAAGYVVKPVQRDALLDAVRKKVQRCETRRCHCLIVDDEYESRLLINEYLSSANYMTTAVSNGKDALATLETLDVDFIVLDLMMPEMDGFEILRHLNDHPSKHKIPVLVCTAKDLSHAETLVLTRHTTAIIDKGKDFKKNLLNHVQSILMSQCGANATVGASEG